MGRPSFPNIGWDPAPGDPDLTRKLGKKIGGLADDLDTSVRELERIECGAWKGKTAVAFTGYITEDVTPLLRKAHASFDKASDALDHWARQMEDFQDEANRLEKRAGDALNADAEAEAKDKDRSETSQAINDVTDKVNDLERRYKAAAKVTSNKLDKATGLAPDEPGFWEDIANDIGKAWDAAVDWVQKHADLIKMIGDFLSDLTAILGTLAIICIPFQPLGAIFGVAALITSGLALASHSLAKAAGADVSWMQIGLDAVGLLPGIGLFGKGVKVANMATATTRARGFTSGFKASKLAAGQRNFMATGDLAGKVKGGASLGKRFTLGGKLDDIAVIANDTGRGNRIVSLGEAGYGQGQWLGTKGLDVLTNGNLAIDSASAMGRAIDGGIKMAPKAFSIPQHVGDAVSPGDRFQEAAASH